MFDGVHTVFSSARFVDFTTISVSCKRNEIMKIAIWSEFVPEKLFSLAETPQTQFMARRNVT